MTIKKISARVPLLVATSAAAMLLAACGSGGSSSDESGSGGSADDLNISFANATEASELFRSLHTSFDDQIKSEDLGVSVKWYDNNLDPGAMLKNANLMVQDKPDAIVEYPVTDVTQGVSKVFSDAKIPCVSINSDVKGCTVMRIDNAMLGTKVGEALVPEVQKRGWTSKDTTILIGNIAAQGEGVNSAVWEFYKTLAPTMGFPEPKTLDNKTTKIADNAYQFNSTATTDGAFAEMKNLLPKIPKGNHIVLFTINDDSTFGALRALEDAGLGGEDNVLTAGEGGSKDAIKALRDDPRWVAQVAAFLDHWGIYTTAAAKAMVDGEKPTHSVTALPQAVITKETVGEYYPDGATSAVRLPPLEESNQWLAKSGLLQKLGYVEGLS